jgi:tetratricopeptide (TPR) repeat protein
MSSHRLAGLWFKLTRAGQQPVDPPVGHVHRSDEIRLALRLGLCEEALAMLRTAEAQWRRNEAEHLNLLGLAYEQRGQWRLARRFYGRAMRADRAYLPAEQNMRRLFELRAFGMSDVKISLGDERPALAELLGNAACAPFRSAG